MSTDAQGARHDGLPCKPTGLADGLGLGSVRRPKGRFAPVKTQCAFAGSPALASGASLGTVYATPVPVRLSNSGMRVPSGRPWRHPQPRHIFNCQRASVGEGDWPQRRAVSSRGPARTATGAGSRSEHSSPSRSGAARPSCGSEPPRLAFDRCRPQTVVCVGHDPLEVSLGLGERTVPLSGVRVDSSLGTVSGTFPSR
jgi:hypothetical protein